jgi:hypothetical protein
VRPFTPRPLLQLTTHIILVDRGCEPDDSTFRLRSYRDGKSVKNVGDTLDTAVGAALLEWNSRLGVPTDVWSLIATAIVTCDSCDLVRSFHAHLLHLDNTGACTDPGQSLTPAGEDSDGGEHSSTT